MTTARLRNTARRTIAGQHLSGAAITVKETGRVRMVDALLCPEGIALRTVTLVNRDGAAILLNGWRLMDRYGRTEALDGLILPPEARLTVTISGLGARFGVRGGSILLLDGHGQVVHIARYTRRMALPGHIARLG